MNLTCSWKQQLNAPRPYSAVNIEIILKVDKRGAANRGLSEFLLGVTEGLTRFVRGWKTRSWPWEGA